MEKLSVFIELLKEKPLSIEFSQTMEVIDENYHFTPTSFKNGEMFNNENENNGSCKIFAFANLHKLTKEETLACFGKYYTVEVLQNPEGSGHQNIRNFMRFGWEKILFTNEFPLVKK